MTAKTLREHEHHVLHLFHEDCRRKSLKCFVERYVTDRRVLKMRRLVADLAIGLVVQGGLAGSWETTSWVDGTPRSRIGCSLGVASPCLASRIR